MIPRHLVIAVAVMLAVAIGMSVYVWRTQVRVAPADMGKVIGRQGRTVRALRSIIAAAGLKQRRRMVLDIVE